MAVERFIWTEHAELRLGQRGLTRFEVEAVVREGHRSREVNRGDADWRVHGVRSDGRRFAVLYDHPATGDSQVARIVSIWPLRDVGVGKS
jgi:Domain of unknown function (DUF4258)